MIHVTSKMSPVESMTFDRFKGHTFLQERVITLTGATVNRIPPNPNRTHWEAVNESMTDIRVSFKPDINGTSGFILAANGGMISMDWEEDGEGVTYDIYLYPNGGDSDIRLRETIIK